jgi:hypothetical protein
MAETLEHWMLNTSILRLARGSYDQERVMFIAQSRYLWSGKRQKVTLPERTGRSIWKVVNEDVVEGPEG